MRLIGVNRVYTHSGEIVREAIFRELSQNGRDRLLSIDQRAVVY